jgi:hypothetical protein
MSVSAIEILSNPSSGSKEYTDVAGILSKDLVKKAVARDALPSLGIHAVAAAADYQLVLEPAIKWLRKNQFTVAVSCLWPISELVVEGIVDTSTIAMALSENGASKMPQLLVMAQSIGTVTELESILAHVLFDMGPNAYQRIVVLSLVSHINAEQHLEALMPEKYRGKLRLLDHRKDHELSPKGVLMPGVGRAPLDRAGFASSASTRSFVPAVFRNKYDFEKRPKPGASPRPPTQNPFK